MPYSYGEYKYEFQKHMIKNFPNDITILDVGVGCGNYSVLLKENFNKLDGVEIFPKYDEMFNLKIKYRNLFIGDIFDYPHGHYDYVILGDIVEHMTIDSAQKLLENIHQNGQHMMVSVPYCMKQGAEYGNEHEVHIQDDLTHELMLERYPYLTLLWKDEGYGYYINYEY